MLIRNFFPVGQGAFYCEQFCNGKERINIVYDCGSSTDVHLVENKIMNFFEPSEDIRAVFISHLDNDHINGIPFLLKHCKVQKLFFPLLTEENLKYIKVSNLIRYGRYSSEYFLLDNFYSLLDDLDIDHRPRLYAILDNEDEDWGNREIEAVRLPSGANIAGYIYNNNEQYETLRDWVYIPFNFRQTAHVKQLHDILKMSFGRDMDNDDLQKIWESGNQSDCKKIKAAYKQINYDMNTNSMTLYSGLKNQCIKQKVNTGIYRDGRSFYNKNNVGCLYTGDYNASKKDNWKELLDAYVAYWNYIGCIQIPHHGSRHNYNGEFAKLDAYTIISAGKKNQYRHPHNYVIKDLLLHNKNPLIVSEESNSEVTLLLSCNQNSICIF